MIAGPLSPAQTDLAQRLLPTLTAEQRSWLGGYLAGWQDAQSTAAPAPVAAPDPAAAVTVVYGSQTGNAKALAEQLAERVRQQGLPVTVHSLRDYDPRRLTQERRLLVVTSTQGDGDPPDNAVAFVEFLTSRKASKLAQLRFAVLALGDSSYEHFCKTGRDMDERLRELGASPLHPRADCDLDYDDAAESWMRGVLAALGAEAGAPASPVLAPERTPQVVASPVASPDYGRSRPFPAEILENIELSGRGSNRSTRHVEISLAGSGLTWQPGDALGVHARNRRDLVEELIQAADWDPNASLDDGMPLVEALTERYELTVLTRPLLARLAEVTGAGPLSDLLRPEREAELRSYVAGRDLVDLLRDFSLRGVPAPVCVGALRRLPPRLYSIASAPAAYPEEPHLTVRLVDYRAHGRSRRGVCSDYLAVREPGERLPVFVQANPNFGLPSDPATPLIMIGAGTGVAPFRAFIQERAETGGGGPSWLFFGDRHFRTDFLYQTDWLRWVEQGVLTRMDIAFSRDGPNKVYVQHRMLEHERELYAWLREGASVYVCGDRDRMAPDVHRALLAIVGRQGGLDPDQAEAYLAELQRTRRYLRDVY